LALDDIRTVRWVILGCFLVESLDDMCEVAFVDILENTLTAAECHPIEGYALIDSVLLAYFFLLVHFKI